MFWLCYEEHWGSNRLFRTWVVEADDAPDKPDENGERAYPFNGMGGYVAGWYDTEEEAYEADYILWGEEDTECRATFGTSGSRRRWTGARRR